MDFFGFGTTELIIILIVALIFVGPEKMVGVARSLGKFIRQVSQASKDFSKRIEEEADLEAARKDADKAVAEVNSVLKTRVSLEPGKETKDEPAGKVPTGKEGT